MIEITPTINFAESHDYCFNCGKDKVKTWDVRLSWRTHEELCEDCLNDLYNNLSNVLLGNKIRESVQK